MEEQVRGLREDVQALASEQGRTRQRLHDLEATTRGAAAQAVGRAQEAAIQAARTQRWMQILALVVALAGVVGPIFYSGVIHH